MLLEASLEGGADRRLTVLLEQGVESVDVPDTHPWAPVGSIQEAPLFEERPLDPLHQVLDRALLPWAVMHPEFSPDGQRFFMTQGLPAPEPSPVTHINLVRSWTEGLKARVPSGK